MENNIFEEKKISWKTKTVISTCLVLAILIGVFANINIQVGEPENQYQKALTIGNVLTLTIGPEDALAATTPDYTCDGVEDNVQFQAALNALPANGGKILVLGGQYNFASTVTRAIDDVIFEGVGYSSYFIYNGAADIFTAGGDRWIFKDIRSDAGGVGFGTTTDWQMLRSWEGGTYYAYRTESGADNIVLPVGRGSTYLIAASNANVNTIAQADLVCDGTADDVQINAALAALTAVGGKVQLSEGTFTLAAQLTYSSSNLTFEGMGANTIVDATGVGVGSSPLINITGTITATNTALTIGGSIADTSVTVASSAGFSADDWVRIRNNSWFNSGSDARPGEIRQLDSAGGNVLTFKTSLGFEHLVSDTATVDLMTMLENITFSNFTLLSETGDLSYGLWIESAVNVQVNNVTIIESEDRAIELRNVVGGIVTGCNISYSNRAGLGYGVAIGNSSRDIVVNNNIFTDCRHAVTSGGDGTYGTQLNQVYDGNTVNYNSQGQGAFNTHNTSQGLIVSNNIINNDAIGSFGALDTTISGNYCYNTISQNGGLYLGDEAQRVTITGNTIIDENPNALAAAITLNGPEYVDIVGNYLKELSGVATIYSNADLNHINICNNVIEGTDETLYIRNNGGGVTADLTHINISDNIINSSAAGIHIRPYVFNINFLNITGNIVTPGAGSNGIYLHDNGGNGGLSQYVLIDDNTVNAGAYGIRVQSTDYTNVTNNNIRSATTAGIFTYTDTTNYLIANNNISNCGTSISELIPGNGRTQSNIGWVTVNSGSSVGTGGQQTLAHGLDVIPAKRDIILTDLDTGADAFVSATPNATNIFITATAGDNYAWRVDTES